MNERSRGTLSRRSFIERTAKGCCHVGLSCVALGCFGADSAPHEAVTEARAAGVPASDFEPAYLELHRTGELRRRAERLHETMRSCELCPRGCGVDRLAGQRGFCRAPGATLVISSAHPHFGEERPLVGRGGSGTIFLSHCSLRCVFCQNWEISQLGRGNGRTTKQLADMMVQLQKSGCHNINLVTPTHYSAAILAALDIAAGRGLRLPIVYNTCGWERLDILAELDGVVDIYLPDFKYWDARISAKLSPGARNYPELTKAAILEMHRQVGVAMPNSDGLILRGLMIRHLVMPNDTGGSARIMEWIARNLPKETYVNIMAQYNPYYKAFDHPEIARRITGQEYRQVVERAQALGLTNLDVQGTRWLRN